ncbi:methyltransferase [Hahella sp. CCB-MM4]|uniref:class I SAM-dependent DNA methyltransferase n=1 Tax=Hahella sp. (strain CCB-MM4) TaxID=1926491 RepID=UPI000B9C543C|nr:class I SAM-dependent methyltransferase [Hahella sp. CCB-MM4]OZG74485.1 methyltransferase [Hahella sp. CCB-MM4]
MSDSWDDYAEGWDSNEDVISYSEKAYKTLIDIYKVSGARVLDFGCGTGLLTEKLSPHASEVVAIDPSEKMISVLNQKGLKNVTTIQAELSEALVNEEASLQQGFDLIVASSVLAFIPQYQDTIALLQRLLKKDGYLVQWDWHKHEGFGFNRDEIEKAYTDAGLSEVLVSVPFAMVGAGGSMEVIMGVGKKTCD